MKKFLSVILTVVMIATVFASVVVVNAADKLQITVDKVEAAAGENAVVNIKLTNNTGINSLLMDLHYGDLEFVKASFPIWDPDDEDMMRSSNNKAEEKRVRLNWISNTNSVSGDVTYATVTFKVPEGAANGTKYELTADIDPENVFDKDGKNIDFDFVAGEVKVPGEPEVVDTYKCHSLDFVYAGTAKVVSGPDQIDLSSASMKKGSVVTILGWAVFSDNLKEMFYTVDGEEQACENVYRDRTEIAGIIGQPEEYCVHAGFGLDNNLMDLLGTDSLDIGTYEISIGARANGGSEKILKTFTLEVVDETEPEPPAAPAITHTCFDAGKVENNTLVNAGGWTGATYKINRLGYTVDGGEPVFAGVTLTELPDSDPVKQEVNAGKYGVRFSIYRDFKDDGLSAGNHTVVLVAELDDDAKTVLPLSKEINPTLNNFVITIEGDTPVDPDPAALHAKSFDNFWADGTQLCNGDALKWLNENPVNGDIQSVGVRGWAWIDNSTIAQFGYKLDNGEPVFSDSFLENRPDVYAQAGATQATANGFTINPVDVSALATGSHTITMLVKAADGTIVEIETAPFSVERPGQAAPELINSYYDELLYDDTQILSGSVDKKVIDPANRASLDFEKGKVSNITVRGWAQLSDNVADIKGFGYSIDGGAVVEGEFVQDRAAELAQAGVAGAQGFLVVVPVSDLEAGEHTIDAYVIAADGTQIKLVKDRSTADAQVINPIGVTFTVTEPEQPTEPADVTTEPEGTTTEGGETPENPGTSDTALIALASVAAVALAGAFIGKKALKK